MGGGQQVGYIVEPTIFDNGHAALWTGSAASLVDLHPAFFNNTIANATDGIHQLGKIGRAHV